MEPEQKVTAVRRILKYEGGRLHEQEDEVVTERPLTIRVDGEEFATLVCTPTELEELTIGFLASEGMIRTAADIRSLALHIEQGIAEVTLVNPQTRGKDWYNKRFLGSCCGKSRQFYFHNDAQTAKTIPVRPNQLTPEQCLGLMRELQRSSDDFRRTGGVHNAALCTADRLLAVRTDIGRHNALDKLYGHILHERIPLKGKMLAFSGRMSSEIILKAAKIGVGILLSKSAPTELGLQLAEELGITVVGFIRGDAFNVYTHAERIAHRSPEQ
ncbi:formate dehydrogenase accessory sulfurtransferase FdhD [Paenibacillus cremeus]|uniref:Sulfur carrier protein FdhD n=1 Tax=Paenibacillus cremeus TaxID=2163881 RepID=A0A559K8X4_9BACL|nr:formate dehydrogenase accessory sulfurtransferase FdhD [Paenibacillus cremeus]TVY08580.1 formate dehydrogenase accessory sulfurtransferase FdhD [Paenibacillus cremeus]